MNFYSNTDQSKSSRFSRLLVLLLAAFLVFTFNCSSADEKKSEENKEESQASAKAKAKMTAKEKEEAEKKEQAKKEQENKENYEKAKEENKPPQHILNGVCIKGNCLSGSGEMKFENDAIYQGEFQNGKPNGKGRMLNKDGSFAGGEFKEGVQHGEGVYYTPVGYFFRGKWVNGLHQGMGSAIFAGGDVFIGRWRFGFRHGEGVLVVKSSNTVIRSTWDTDMRDKSKDEVLEGDEKKKYLVKAKNIRVDAFKKVAEANEKMGKVGLKKEGGEKKEEGTAAPEGQSSSGQETQGQTATAQ